MLRPLLAAFALLAVSPAAYAAKPALTVEPYEFTARDGTMVAAEKGTFEVPENRADPKSRKIKLAFMRFPATTKTPGDPIVYLAGGPGGSGVFTAQGARFPLFMALRDVADVIAFEQRGVGMSNQIPFCKDETPPPASDPVTRASLVAYYREELTRCFDWWEAQGVDIDGYTTLESAHDIEDLRRALGAKKVNLWGISYGSHLGLAVLKYHSPSVNRAVFAGIEALDQTVKRPALTDDLVARVQTLIDADPAAKALYPDLAGMMRRVHAKLNAEPARATFTPRGASEPVTVTFDGFLAQLLAGFSISDPSGIARLPLLYLALDNGMYEQAAQIIYSQFLANAPGFDGMPQAMDLASGISTERLALVSKEAETAILGDALNFPMPHILGIRDGIDLGEKFREPFKSRTPTLFISGTLDGRTYVSEAKEALKQLSNGKHLIVENGGHNIYEADPRVAEAVVAWFNGESVPATITFEPPVFAKP